MKSISVFLCFGLLWFQVQGLAFKEFYVDQNIFSATQRYETIQSETICALITTNLKHNHYKFDNGLCETVEDELAGQETSQDMSNPLKIMKLEGKGTPFKSILNAKS